MIAVDGTDLDQRLAEEAYRLFGPESQFFAVNVRDPSMSASPMQASAMFPTAAMGFGMAYPYMAPYPYQVAEGADGSTDTSDEERREALARETAESAGLDDAQVVAEAGDPPSAIRRAANEHRIDVIVVGSHERSWWSKLIDSSVSSELVQESRIPVLVVREPASNS
jgi:nucleotide-binding universal stress UspA family protein